MGVNDQLGLKSITQHQKNSFGETIRVYLNEAWYFEKWFEKLILVGLGILGMWKILEFFI